MNSIFASQKAWVNEDEEGHMWRLFGSGDDENVTYVERTVKSIKFERDQAFCMGALVGAFVTIVSLLGIALFV